jgi:hypothetical protein
MSLIRKLAALPPDQQARLSSEQRTALRVLLKDGDQ